MSTPSGKLLAHHPAAAQGRVLAFARNSIGRFAGAAIEFSERSGSFPAVCEAIQATTVPGEVSETDVRRAFLQSDDLLLDDGTGEGASAVVLWNEGDMIRGIGVGGCSVWVFAPGAAATPDLAMDIPRKPMLGEGIVALRTRPIPTVEGQVIVAGGHSLSYALDHGVVREIVRAHMAIGAVDRIPATVAEAAWAAGERAAILCHCVPVAQGLPNPWRTA